MRGREDVNDEAFLRALAHAHMRAVRGVIASRERNSHDVEELVADVFTLAYTNLATLRGAKAEHVRGWLLRTARYVTANHVRRSITRRQLLDRLRREPLPLEPSPDEEFEHREDVTAADETMSRVVAVLGNMRTDYRQTLLMDAHGLKSREIGQKLGVTDVAARHRLKRARQKLRAAYASATESESSGVPDV